MSTPSRLIFLHIPKSGGTAFHNVLMQHYSPADLCPERLRFLDRMPDDQIGKYKLYSGHFYFDQLARIPNPQHVITLLREPRERLLSLYYFFRAHRWDQIEHCERAGVDSPRLAKELDLLAYLKRPDYLVRLYAHNATTRHLIGLKYVGADGQLLVSEDEAFEIAVQNLKGMPAFGILEAYMESRKFLSAAVGFGLPETLPKDNTFEEFAQNSAFERSERQTNFDDETEAEIQGNIRIDKRVYDWAVNHLQS